MKWILPLFKIKTWTIGCKSWNMDDWMQNAISFWTAAPCHQRSQLWSVHQVSFMKLGKIAHRSFMDVRSIWKFSSKPPSTSSWQVPSECWRLDLIWTRKAPWWRGWCPSLLELRPSSSTWRGDAAADQYKLTNIVKWKEIDKVNEMNTATLQNWNMDDWMQIFEIETWTTGCKMRFRFGMLHCATKDHNCDLFMRCHLWSSARPPTEASWMCGASEN